jgi:DNA repair protein RecN (Recombination protein N)
MLHELTITNFAIIDRLRLDFAPHLNVFTGETGAGKSIIVDAVSALVGERVAADVVRTGADRATVEGVFDVTALLGGPASEPADEQESQPGPDGADGASGEAGTRAASLAELLIELGIDVEDDGTLILAREIQASGRGIARINGRAVPISTLQRIGRFLVDIHGQSAHLELLRPEQHVHYLDRFAGTVELRQQVTELVGQWRAARRELERLRRDEREIERRIELLRYQVDEIEAARVRPGEEEELEAERRRLANAERLGELSEAVHAALAGDSDADTSGALDLLAGAQRAFGELLRLDETLREQEGTLEQALYLLQDVTMAVRSYQDEIAADPERQAEVEERLDLLAKLRRKYGATAEEIVAYASSAAEELEELEHREERAAALVEREADLKRRIGQLAGELSQQRQVAAVRLSKGMDKQLDELNMRRARFEAQVTRTQDPAGAPVSEPVGTRGKAVTTTYAFGPNGIDRVEFLIAPNPGEPLKPLARIASGGETSRLMLALKTILSTADIVPTLIFDEIDAGISGRTGQVVGEKLWQLGRSHQVLCVTHLPQIAALGDRHYRVVKAVSATRTITQVEQMDAGKRLAELSQMLGGADTTASRANAAELLDRGDAWKQAAAAR